MSLSAGLWAHLQTWLLLVALAALLPQRLRRKPWLRYGTPPLLLGAAVLPLGTLDLTGLLYGYSGALSLTSLALLAAFTGRRLWGLEPLRAAERRRLLQLLAAATVLLYPPALGLCPFDPYGPGYTGLWPPLLLGLGAALAWWRRLPRLAWLLLATLWAWLLHLGESDNLWDYLLDGWLALYLLARAAGAIGTALRARF